MSCTKAREAFAESAVEITEECDAKTNVVGPDEVWQVLSSARIVNVASGQKTLTFKPGQDDKEELIKKTTGRTGNLRAPAVRLGTELYVGFNVPMYESLVK